MARQRSAATATRALQAVSRALAVVYARSESIVDGCVIRDGARESAREREKIKSRRSDTYFIYFFFRGGDAHDVVQVIKAIFQKTQKKRDRRANLYNRWFGH